MLCGVFSRTGSDENIGYVSNVVQLVQQLKSQPGKHIYCDGGGGVVATLLKAKLIDRLIISVIPCLVGDGIRLFRDGRPEQGLSLREVKTFPTGLVQMHYDCKNGST